MLKQPVLSDAVIKPDCLGEILLLGCSMAVIVSFVVAMVVTLASWLAQS